MNQAKRQQAIVLVGESVVNELEHAFYDYLEQISYLAGRHLENCHGVDFFSQVLSKNHWCLKLN